jgi:hypothetical protein
VFSGGLDITQSELNLQLAEERAKQEVAGLEQYSI